MIHLLLLILNCDQIIIILILLLFTPMLADDFSRFRYQQVSLSLQESSQYSGQA